VFLEDEKQWVHACPTAFKLDKGNEVEAQLRAKWNAHPGKGEVPKEVSQRASCALVLLRSRCYSRVPPLPPSSNPHPSQLQRSVSYCIGAENDALVDVTRRYAGSYSTSKQLRDDEFICNLLAQLNSASGSPSSSPPMSSKEQLQLASKKEKPPKTKEAFKQHPHFALKSQLLTAQVVAPGAKSNGVAAGEVIYLRSDVSVARGARKWLLRGRKVSKQHVKHRSRPRASFTRVYGPFVHACLWRAQVREDEIDKPCKEVKARKRVAKDKSVFVNGGEILLGGGAPKPVGLRGKYVRERSEYMRERSEHMRERSEHMRERSEHISFTSAA